MCLYMFFFLRLRQLNTPTMSCFLIISEGGDRRGVFFFPEVHKLFSYFTEKNVHTRGRVSYSSIWSQLELSLMIDDVCCWRHTVLENFLDVRCDAIGNWFGKHESLEAHSSKWQIIMKSQSSMMPVCVGAQVEHQHRDSQIASLHHFTQPCSSLFFSLPGDLSEEVKGSVKKRKFLKFCFAKIFA